ncbi:hypothetical protein MY1884_006464 [Beauveria asiatica]
MTRTESSPSILLHAWPHNMNWKIRVENLDSYIENKNGSPTIPILYLRDADYLIRDTAVEYKHNDNLYSGPRHAYSFVATHTSTLHVRLALAKERIFVHRVMARSMHRRRIRAGDRRR